MEKTMSRIQTISTYFFYLFSGLLVLSPLMTIFLWAFMNDLPHDILTPYLECAIFMKSPGAKVFNVLDKLPLALEHRLVALGGALFSQLPLYLGYFVLRRLFSLYRTGLIFGASTVLCYRRLGFLMIAASAFFIPLGEGISMMALSLSNPPGSRVFGIGFGTPGLEMILMGLIIIVISWIMDEGRKIEEERSYIV
jgi:hypothetical protein